MEFDYVIVGAGSAGCVVADILSRDGKNSVAIIEAGSNKRNFWINMPMGYGRTYRDPEVNWQFSAEPVDALNGRAGYWPRGKTVGGSSAINALVYYRGLPQDFDDWQESGAEGWSWQDVEPHFGKIEQQIAVDGKITGNGPQAVSDVSAQAHPVNRHFLDAARELNIPVLTDLNGPSSEGVGHYQITTKNGRRVSAADAFLRPALERKNLTLIAQAMVQRVLFQNKRATGIEIKQSGKLKTIRARKEVILCAGAIGSPQLLQVSGIGDAENLKPLGIDLVLDNPNIGGHLQDHLAINYYFEATEPTLNNQLNSWTGKIWAGMKYVFGRRGPLVLSVNQCGGFVKANANAKAPDTQLYFSPLTYGNTGPEKNSRINPDPYPGFLLSYQPCRPTSEGRIDICSNDISVPPIIKPNSLDTQKDLDDVIGGGGITQQFARSLAMQNITKARIAEDIEELDDEGILADFRARASTVFHPVSTCRMGANIKDSVVGPDLRVHGIESLRVIDASAFPNITSGNTNAPTLMLAHKAAAAMLTEKN